MKHKNFHFLVLAMTLTLSTLACSIAVGGPDYPAQAVPSAPEEAQAMRDLIEQAFLAGAETGVVTLQITESQMTSFITEKISQQVNPPFTDPVVFLRNGQMQVYGKINRGWFTANMLIAVNVTIDPTTGLPKFEIASADFGPFPVPEGLNSAISTIIDETFTGSIGPAAVGFRLETITIADGVMTITGRIK